MLDTSILWREVVTAMAADYPDVALSHMYVDNAAMQLLKNPKQFDVIVTGNIFGDILSDEASMLAGSIGMLPSASLDANQKGLYEPIHGSAPDIAGQDKANPLATILSLAMMFRYTFARPIQRERIEGAVRRVLQQGHRTGDIALPGEKVIGTRAMGEAVVAALRAIVMAATPAITIRRAAVADAEAIQATFSTPKAMAGTLQVPFPSVEKWRKRLADSPADDYVLVAEVGGEVVGNLGLHLASKSPRRRHAAGLGMSVRDDWHSRGVGNALLAAAIDLADNWLNYTRIELTVYTDNAVALALYRKFGFEIEGTLKSYAFRDGRFIDAYTMARLAPAKHIATKRIAAKGKVPAAKRKRPA